MDKPETVGIKVKLYSRAGEWRAETQGRLDDINYRGIGVTPAAALADLTTSLEKLIGTKVLLLLGFE